jgi:hypothetical protein
MSRDTTEPPPLLLLIVRERLRPGMEQAYSDNELELATACATLKCPHPYLALASGPNEVWWLNAFASQEERDQLDDAYARNEPLMARLMELGKRKERFRETFTTTLTKYRFDLSDGLMLRLVRARFFVINIVRDEREVEGAVFESSDRERFVVASAHTRAEAERLVGQAGPGSVILAVQPQWSFPDEAWIAADPDFWSSSPAARKR